MVMVRDPVSAVSLAAHDTISLLLQLYIVISIMSQCFTLGPSFGCHLASTIAVSYDPFANFCGPLRYHILQVSL